jgi:hypothetical protein
MALVENVVDVNNMQTAQNENSEFLTEYQLERILCFPTGSLRKRRYRGFKIPHVKIGDTIRYHWPTVKVWLLGNSVEDLKEQPSVKKRRGRPRKILA